jgi:IclR family KDG regulon transcriptional repressor
MEIYFHIMTTGINQSLAHGLNVLLLYDTTASQFTVSEISKHLGYSQSKAYRLVRTLVRSGFLQENPGTAQYSLGLSIFRLGLIAQENFTPASVPRPFMKDLSLRTRETVLLTAVNGARGIVLERVESEEPIRCTVFQPGATLPLHGGASSKILMAYLPEKEWDRIITEEGLRSYTRNTITNAKRLKKHLKEIRKKGYAFSDQEVDRDVRAVAAPVFSGSGELMAGLSIAGPAYRINKKKVYRLIKLVVEYAQKISSKMGYEAHGNSPR